MKHWDIFLSHASEDKLKVATPLAELLEQFGFRVWLDEHVLVPGRSLREQIDHGLANSEYGLLLVSRHFIQKSWPTAELNALFSSAVQGRVRLIPIWHGVSEREVAEFSPMLADRYALSTRQGLHDIVRRIASAIQSTSDESQITHTALLTRLIEQRRPPRDYVTFLVSRPEILSRAHARRCFWRSARTCIACDSLSGVDDFLLGTAWPGTELVLPIMSCFFLSPDERIVDESKPTESLEFIIDEIIRIYDADKASLIECIVNELETQSFWRAIQEDISVYEKTRPLLFAGRRQSIGPNAINTIQTIREKNGIKIHTFDWLLDACQSLDYSRY